MLGTADFVVTLALTFFGLNHARIARALMLEPKILLLDEPTSALDVPVQAEILNLLKRQRAEQNLTFLLVTHNLMRRGRIVEIAAIEQLKRGGLEHPYSRELAELSGGRLPLTQGPEP